MKLIQEPIVFADETDNPLCHFFQWRQRIYYVHQLLEDWFYRGKWWQDPRLEGERRHYFRVSSYHLPPNSKVFPPGSKNGDLSALRSVRYAPEIRMHQTYSDSFSRRRIERTAWTPEQLGCRPEQTKIFEIFFLSPGARNALSYAGLKVAKSADQLQSEIRGQQSQSERSNPNRKGGLRPEPGVQGSALVRGQQSQSERSNPNRKGGLHPESGVQGSALVRGQQSQSERSNPNRKGGLHPESGVQGSALVRGQQSQSERSNPNRKGGLHPESGVQGSALASWILSRCLD